jgi:lysophospholipase L1-like esterase
MLRIIIGVLFSLSFMPTIYAEDTIPHLYVIDDSIAENYEKQRHPLTGWAQVLQEYLDESKIVVINKAISGRSSKSY